MYINAVFVILSSGLWRRFLIPYLSKPSNLLAEVMWSKSKIILMTFKIYPAENVFRSEIKELVKSSGSRFPEKNSKESKDATKSM